LHRQKKKGKRRKTKEKRREEEYQEKKTEEMSMPFGIHNGSLLKQAAQSQN